MKTLLSIAEDRLATAKSLGGHKTKSETVNHALETYIRSIRQTRLLDRIGKGFGLTKRHLAKMRRAS